MLLLILGTIILVNLLMIRFLLEKDCLHEYVELKRKRTANASFFNLSFEPGILFQKLKIIYSYQVICGRAALKWLKSRTQLVVS